VIPRANGLLVIATGLFHVDYGLRPRRDLVQRIHARRWVSALMRH
jgi:hypothetical protein